MTTGPEPTPAPPDDRISVAVFSGPTATLLNTPGLITSNQARARRGLPPASHGRYDQLRPQRLAAPVKVYVEAFSAHPLERDARELYGEPDGYLDAAGNLTQQPSSPSDVPVFEVVLTPEDGLYLLPYMAMRRDGTPWEAEVPTSHEAIATWRQTFYPDASRLVEEIDRFGIDAAGGNNVLSRRARFEFYRAAPSAGYTGGVLAGERTDIGPGAIAAERAGRDYFPYVSSGVAKAPARESLVEITNVVQSAVATGRYDGAIWVEGSPAVEETAYWLNLLIDTTIPLCATASQRKHGELSNDGDRNLVDCVSYLASGIWADEAGRDCLGLVVIQDEQAFTSREVQKADSRPGGFVATGGHGGVVASVGASGEPVLSFRPVTLATHRSSLRLTQMPERVAGTPAPDGAARTVAIRSAEGGLQEGSIAKVTIVKYARYGTDGHDADPAQEVEIAARIEANRRAHPLAGFVLEGNAPYGRADESTMKSLTRAVLCGMPVVCVGRGNAEGHGPRMSGQLLLRGSNLTATKARLLLMACLMRYGAAPAAVSPGAPTRAEVEAVRHYLDRLQQIFQTH